MVSLLVTRSQPDEWIQSLTGSHFRFPREHETAAAHSTANKSPTRTKDSNYYSASAFRSILN